MRFKQFLSEIKISLKSNPNLDAFMKEYHEHTTQHPWSPRMSVWQDKVMAEVSKWQGRIHISSIMSLEKNKGHSSEFMKWLTALADKHQVTMDLDVHPIKNAGNKDGKDLNKTQLRAWYVRNGFKKVSGDYMEREPKSLTEEIVKPWEIETIDVKRAVDLLNLHCKKGLDAITNSGLLYRGFKHDVAVMTINSSKGDRTSRDTNNAYQLMMDLSDSMKDYPSRSKSLICSSNLGEAAFYGNPMIIVPYDGTEIVCSVVNDFLDNEINSQWVDDVDIQTFSSILEKVVENLGTTIGFGDSQLTMKHVQELNEYIKDNAEFFSESWIKYFKNAPEEQLLKLFADNKDKPFQALASKIFTPETLSLRKIEFGNKLPRNVESWFSGPCIAIDARLFAGIVHALSKNGHDVHKNIDRNFSEFISQWPSLDVGELTDDAIQYIQSNLS